MKRGVAVLLAGVMALGMSMTVFADYGSVESTDSYVGVSVSDVEAADDSDVTISKIEKSTDPDGYAAGVALVEDSDNETLADAASIDDAEDYSLGYLIDVTATSTGTVSTFSIYIDEDLDDVIVLHYTGGKWVLVDSVYDSESGLLTITTDGLSPFAIYVAEADEDEDADDETEDTDEDADEEESDTEGTSDETGEGTYVLYIVALAALAGLAVSTKMRRA